MESYLAPGLSIAGIQLALTFKASSSFLIVCIDTEQRPCPTLTLDTVTEGDDIRFTACRDAQRAALALSNPVHPAHRYFVAKSPTISQPPPAAPATRFHRHRPAA